MVCVIDVSGSMDDEVQVKNQSGDNESFGLSILDLVKHSVSTIIENLKENDRLSLIAFHTEAFKVTDLTAMTTEGKKEALKLLRDLTPLNSTNIWDGLYRGLEVIREGQLANEIRNSFSQILLFTDGQPNVEPPRGHIPTLKKYKEEHPQVNCAINTFGFGYNLDSKLLNEIAMEGRGSFAFIPDGQFVGTVFVNALSNLMSTLAVDAVLCLEAVNGSSFPEEHAILGDLEHLRVSWGLSVNLDSLQFGQSKDVVVRMNNIGNTE